MGCHIPSTVTTLPFCGLRVYLPQTFAERGLLEIHAKPRRGEICWNHAASKPDVYLNAIISTFDH